jgi:hypothetical protein
VSDVVSIELLLDEATEARVRADWRRLADAGYRASPRTPHRATGRTSRCSRGPR